MSKSGNYFKFWAAVLSRAWQIAWAVVIDRSPSAVVRDLIILGIALFSLWGIHGFLERIRTLPQHDNVLAETLIWLVIVAAATVSLFGAAFVVCAICIAPFRLYQEQSAKLTAFRPAANQDGQAEWVKGTFIVTDGKTASISTEYAKTGARLRVFVDYSGYVRAIGFAGWSKRIRKPLVDVRDFVKGERLSIALISKGDRPGQEEALCWGTPDAERGALKNPLGFDRHATRIAFVGDDGSEQYFPFFVVKQYGYDGRQSIVLIQGDDLSVFQKWLAED